MSIPPETHDGLPPPIPGPVEKPRFQYAAPGIVMVLGILVLAIGATLEVRFLKDQMWRGAIVFRTDVQPWEGMLPIRLRQLPEENFEKTEFETELEKQARGEEVIEILGLRRRETVVEVPIVDDVLTTLVESGRAPERGKNEVLAGALCRLDTFVMDGETFTVTGQLQRGTMGFAFSYLVPDDPTIEHFFTDSAGGKSGWLDPDGANRIAAGDIVPSKAVLPDVAQMQTPTTPLVTGLGVLGISLLALGGSIFQARFLVWLNSRMRLFCDVLDAATEFPRLYAAMHATHFGVILLAITAALSNPLANMGILSLVTDSFTKGELSHLGDAYLSGNVVAATWQTFINNFIVQTVAMAIIPSLVIPFIGVFKTLLSLALAGFALAPLWTGLVGRFTFHSITLLLEVEGYAIASFAICLFPVYVLRAFRQENIGLGLMKAANMMGWGTVLSGAILMVAACYEAVTLILLM